MTEFIRIHDQEVRQLLTQLEAKMDDMSPVMREIAGIMKTHVDTVFEREGIPRWPAPALRTIVMKKRRGKWPAKILHDTGTLSKTQASYATHAAKVSPPANRADIAYYHQHGTSRMPARPIFVWHTSVIGEIRLKLLEWLLKK